MSMVASPKDLQPREYDGAIPFFMNKTVPPANGAPIPVLGMQSFDLVRVSVMPKNEVKSDALPVQCPHGP